MILTPKQYGENGEIEYGWSNDKREWIVQFFFQLTRMNEECMFQLEMRLREFLYDLVISLQINSSLFRKEYCYYFILLYKMIGHTRDIINGKGEYTLTYMLISVWYDFFPELAIFALHALNSERLTSNSEHPYGSWKDIKYFCNYYKNKNGNENHPLIKECIKIFNSQLLLDYFTENTSISLVTKWIPREKSKKFGWLFPYLAYDYFEEYICTAKEEYSIMNAKKKCKMEYRKLTSKLNKKLNTLEVLQCGQHWSKIDFQKISSIALNKQKKSFLYEKKKSFFDLDRALCKIYFKIYIEDCKTNENLLRCKNVSMNEFTKIASNIIDRKNKIEIKNNSKSNSKNIKCNTDENNTDENLELEKELLDMQWEYHSKQTDLLGPIIPIIDLSQSMFGEPKNAAIAFGIRVASKSTLGKRIILLSSTPSWINLENKSSFTDCVEEIKRCDVDINSNLYSVFDMIIETIINTNMKPENISDLSIILFSDMQVDMINKIYKNCFVNKIKEKYQNTGLGLGLGLKSLKLPKLILWNLRSTNGFPVLSLEPNVIMLSGYQTSSLNSISSHGLKVLGEKTSWKQLEEILMNKRYNILENKATEILQKYKMF